MFKFLNGFSFFNVIGLDNHHTTSTLSDDIAHALDRGLERPIPPINETVSKLALEPAQLQKFGASEQSYCDELRATIKQLEQNLDKKLLSESSVHRDWLSLNSDYRYDKLTMLSDLRKEYRRHNCDEILTINNRLKLMQTEINALVTAQSPAATAQSPAATAQSPAATAQSPAANTQSPAATAQSPAATAQKQKDDIRERRRY